jgi:hypothetical protein
MWYLLLRLNAGVPQLDNGAYLPVPLSSNMDHICRVSNSFDVQIEDEEEPSEAAWALDSDDDRLVQEMTEQEIELIRCLCPECDPAVHEFSSLSHSNGAYAKGRDDELLEAPDNADSIEIKVGLIFKDLPTLRRWLQKYFVNHKRPFKVRHSYVQRCYTVVCDVSDCNWRVCARRQKETRKFKITKIVGPHTCAQTELSSKHRQLTSTLIAKRLLGTLKGQPNLNVKSIMTMT